MLAHDYCLVTRQSFSQENAVQSNIDYLHQFLIGLAVMILMIPINGIVAQKMKKYQVRHNPFLFFLSLFRPMQCDQIGLFILGQEEKFSYKNSPNSWQRFRLF